MLATKLKVAQINRIEIIRTKDFIFESEKYPASKSTAIDLVQIIRIFVLCFFVAIASTAHSQPYCTNAFKGMITEPNLQSSAFQTILGIKSRKKGKWRISRITDSGKARSVLAPGDSGQKLRTNALLSFGKLSSTINF